MQYQPTTTVLPSQNMIPQSVLQTTNTYEAAKPPATMKKSKLTSAAYTKN
jgi:hypothetical protein